MKKRQRKFKANLFPGTFWIEKSYLQMHIYKTFIANVHYFLFPSFFPLSSFLLCPFLFKFSFYFPFSFPLFYFIFLIFFLPSSFLFSSSVFPFSPPFYFFLQVELKVQLVLQTVHSQSTGTAEAEENRVYSCQHDQLIIQTSHRGEYKNQAHPQLKDLWMSLTNSKQAEMLWSGISLFQTAHD